MRHFIMGGVLGLSAALAAYRGQSSRSDGTGMAAAAQSSTDPSRGARGDSAQAVARACELVRTVVLRSPAAPCHVAHFVSTPEEYVIRFRVNLQAEPAMQAVEVRLAKRKREATVTVIPKL